MIDKNDIWQRVTTSLKSGISPSEIQTWFAHTSLRKLDPVLAEIQVPNKFVAGWLRDNYLGKIQNSFRQHLDFLPEIRFIYKRPSANHDAPEYVDLEKPTGRFEHQLNPLWTFESFVTSKSNRFAFCASLDVANNPGSHYNPLYLFSKLSLGKTHLLNAIGIQALRNNPLTHVAYVSAHQFSVDFSQAKKNRRLTAFREAYRNADILLLDDIHLIAGRQKSQEELISLFNILFDTKKQIVAAGKTTPNQIPNLLTQFRSRLEWGLISEIQSPDQKTKTRIIQGKAREEDLQLPEDVVFFLANASSDLKDVIQYLVNLQTYASLYQRKIDMSIVKSIIKNRNVNNISARNIQKVTAGHFNVSLSDLLSNKKKRRFSYPRQVAMYLTRHLTELSYKEIGKAFGNKDHTTAMYAVKRIQRQKDSQKTVMEDIHKLQGFFNDT